MGSLLAFPLGNPSQPFYTGAQTVSSVPGEFPVAIGGHPYVVELKEYRRRTLPSLRQPQDTGEEPGENSLNTEGFWRRTQTDWSLGAGQEFFDNEDSSRRRFYTSKGVDPWTPNQLTLLSDTALRQSSANTNLKVLSVNGYFYFVDGATLKHTTTPDAPSWTTVTLTGVGAAITSITTDGSLVFVCDGSQVFKSTVGTNTSSVLTSTDADVVGYANGRLLAADANVIFEIAAAGTTTSIKTHDNASFVWNVIAGAPNGIYVAGNSGDRNEIYYIGVDSSAGSLLTPVHAMALPLGETLNCMAHYGGVMLLGTSVGVRVATIGSANELSHGPVIRIGSVQCVEPQGQFAWFGWTNYDGTSTGLGRVNLAEFTAPLVPAYATDLMATVQGNVLSAATFAGKRYFAVSASGMHGEAATKVSSGAVISGWVRYGTVERKFVSSIDLRHDTLPTGGSVTVTVSSDTGTTSDQGSSAVTGSLGPEVPVTLGAFNAEAFRVSMTLNRATDTAAGPTLRRWTARSLPMPFRTEEFIVPIILENTVDAFGSDKFFDPYVEFLYLKSLEAQRSVVTYQEGGGSYSVYVDAIEVRPVRWTDEHQFFEGLVLVRLLTVDA